jgi:putative Ca2+/H+ antiporter (TMEM165/GDT1 family)
VPARFHGFFPSFSLMVFGEFGDKTQLITISLAAQYGATSAIWFGEMFAIVPVSLVTALFFNRVSHRFDRKWLHRAAAAIFLLFALDILAMYTIGKPFLPI